MDALVAYMQRAAAHDPNLRTIFETWSEIPEAMQHALAEMARSAATKSPSLANLQHGHSISEVGGPAALCD